ncbi:MAG: hypothetical protein ASARMPREDX12_008000 [Alectoria sarmentosa]|nr:MAG: hypothetical protein ASARMPREDX12_008000 [Alectoria sarmentosa]
MSLLPQYREREDQFLRRVPTGEEMSMKKSEAAAECVSEEALVHLKSYKYSSVDKSLISHYILRHYWNAFVELLPLWLAPNMVTLLGFFFILTNVICLEIWVPDLVGPGPSWLYYSFAVGLWMYSTMDNVDGKQARRTGQSSGLGELFDHGIDSLNCTLASLCETAALALGPTPKGVFTALIPCLPMFFSTWETYHTHTLYLGYFNGPTEGLILACTVMILSGYYGPGIWHHPISDLVGHSEIIGHNSIIDLWIPIIFGTFLIAHLPACVYNVVKARREQGLPVAPIILAHLTRQPFPYWTVMLVPLLGGAVLGNLPRVGLSPVTVEVELWYLRAYFVFAMVVYFRWALLVINSICAYLGINCLTITKKPAPGQGTMGEKSVSNGFAPERHVPNGRVVQKGD